MNYYAVTYRYPEGDEDIARVRPTHREFLQSLLADGTLVGSGPYAGGDALIIIRLPEGSTIADAEALMDKDPYRLEGVLPGREIKEWTPVLNVFE
ncbi:MAG: hypothetical protein GX595_00645 [Lentisphaerae bacterium]|nr:hypothetical protein [Lentisphaerota bacterium]